jgi:LDH2 family malate/lactate/ureidoglycolate dehydrogenase
MNAYAAVPVIHRAHDALQQFATALFNSAGLDADKAKSVAANLVLTDMMGRATHGLAQCGAYLDQIVNGDMTKSGAPQIVRDAGSTIVWDGNYLPGLWLMDRALSVGFERLPQHGVVTFSIRRSHHIGCLAAIAKHATDKGYFAMIASSGPHTKAVAPFGGKQGLFSPNPFAIGFPTTSSAVLVDICASLTTVSMVRERTAANQPLDHAWALDGTGRPTRDPSVVERANDPGSLLLLGGAEAGHKGFGLALMVEALTQGLSGFGRKDRPTRWGASVYLQLIDPQAFAGHDAFIEQTGFFADECRVNPAIDPDRPVRLPGEQAQSGIERCRVEGVPISAATDRSLREWADKLGVDASVLN